VVRELLEVRLLLGQLALEIEQLFLLALPDSVVLVGALAPLEGIAGDPDGNVSCDPIARYWCMIRTPGPSWAVPRCRRRPCGTPWRSGRGTTSAAPRGGRPGGLLGGALSVRRRGFASWSG